MSKRKRKEFGVYKRVTVIIAAGNKCEVCGRHGSRVSSYNLNLCRHCFRELAVELGFKKYS